MQCCDCCNLDCKNKKEGSFSGAKYYCKKIDKYVDGSCDACDQFDKSYSRTSYEKDCICEEGHKYSDDCTPISTYITIFVVILVVGNLMKYIV